MRGYSIGILLYLTAMLIIGYFILYMVGASRSSDIIEDYPIIRMELFPGAVSVKDGDTFKINKLDVTVRVAGIDAMEKRQQCFLDNKTSCAAAASDRLWQLLVWGDLLCVKTGRSYDRIVMQCSVGGKDIGETMVSEGLAFHDRRFTKKIGAQYQLSLDIAENYARENRIGFWVYENPERPWDWRAKN